MKKTVLILAVAITTIIGAFAQAPQAFNYQGIARDNVGNELTYQKISLQISILQGSDTGPSVYVETHIDTTNEFGLFNLEIGGGNPVSGNFATINWGSNTHYLKVEMDATGGTSYQFMGTSQLLSVPYALYAGAAPGSSAQTLSFSGDTLSISSGNFVVIIDNVDDADADPTNELQAISISNDTLLLSNGGTVYLGNYLDNTDNQTLSLAGDTLSISNGNNVILIDNVDDADADSTNELQTLSISGSDLTISNGNTLTLPATAPSDTSLYSYDAGYADTAGFAYDAGYADTAGYAYDAGFADTADYAYDAGYADTAGFAWNAFWSDSGSDIYYNTGNVGIGTASPGTKLDIDGALSVRGITAPAVSPAVQGRIYFDSGTNKFKVSENGGAYVDLVGGGGSNWTLSGTDIYNSNPGNVGIGTNSPVSFTNGKALHIEATGTNVASLKLTNFNNGSSSSDGFNINMGSSFGAIMLLENFPLLFGTNNTERMRIDNNGNVGIGTTGPGARLDIVGSVLWGNPTAAQGTLDYGTVVVVGSKTNYPLRLVTNDIERVLIDIAGNVGIGTTSPGTKLDINGALSVRGMASPAVSPAVQGRIYFDSGTDKFKVSENGGAYVDLVGGGGSNWTLNVTDIYNSNPGNVGIGTTSPDGKFNVSAGGDTAAFVVNATTGNVGIGTNSPVSFANGKALHIEATGTNVASLKLTNFNNGSSSSDGFNINMGSTFGAIMLLENYPLLFGTNNTERMRIDNAGNVGIGTTAPDGDLHIHDGAGSTYASLVFSHSGTGTAGVFGGEISMLNDDFRVINKEPASLHLGTDDSFDLTIITGGNVGIGTTSPGAKLEISGDFIARTGLTTGSVANIENNIASGISGSALTVTNSGIRTIGHYAMKVENLVTKTGGSNATKTGLWIESTGAWSAGGSNHTNRGLYVNVSGGDTYNYSAIFQGGNVGIGTTNPDALLHVRKTGANGIINIDTDAGGSTYTQYLQAGVVKAFMGYNAFAPNRLTFWIGGSERMVIDIAGNVGIGTTNPTTIFEVACPAGFANIKKAGNQLGCIDSTESNGGVGLTWEAASAFCFDNFGGRLPTTGEWYISMANFVLTDEVDDWERNDDYSTGANVHAVSGSGGITIVDATSDPTLETFRCWIPR